MPRTIWSGAISFGLVTVPIHVVSATENHAIRFHQYHLEDMSRVRVRKICEIEDREVSQEEIGKAYEISKDTLIAVTDEELREMPLPTAKAIEIAAFVPAASIDPLQVGDGYYLQADGQVAAKPYKLLRMALERSAKVAIAKYAWSGRERLGMLRVRDDAIVLHAMRWPDEIRSPQELVPDAVEVSDDEIEGAQALIDHMTRDTLEGPEFEDHYTDALAEVIKAKREGHAPPEAPAPEAPAGKVVDLMAALEASVKKARASRGEGDADVHELHPKKKTAAKKTATAAKKTTKKKTTKKTAAKPKRSA
ncbi:non-homologous end joining protein Ku [Streptomyces tauricus]|uniref:non-homologous end joining protein Ku n=1 Tax=Streptomyces tauricus TaxID=68274 RepID=UPI002243A5E5|nr:Ku protein [Streptomyces tauricus]MCW8102660.1 Ku protein [Streptomyces tauricus]